MGKVFPPGELVSRAIRRIQQDLGLSTPKMGIMFNVSSMLVADWEAGRKEPEAMARRVIMIVAGRLKKHKLDKHQVTNIRAYIAAGQGQWAMEALLKACFSNGYSPEVPWR